MQTKTTCLYLLLAQDGEILRTDYAWPDPADRRGDGMAEADAFIEASRDNGFSIRPLPFTDLGPGLPPGVESGEVYQYLATFDEDEEVRFGLAVVPVR